MIRIGLIGLGAIGEGLVRLVERDAKSPISVVGALVRAPRERGVRVTQVETLGDLLSAKPDVVAETAGHGALRSFGPDCLRAGVPLVLLSVGALADERFENALRAAAIAGGLSARVASGSIGGLDLLASAAKGGLESVCHRIIKPPGALGLSSDAQGELFRGSARRAALEYPQNANVAAAVALAGIGLDASEVIVESDPCATRNRHRIEVAGAFGSATISIEGRPSVANPRTGALVPMSLKHELEKNSAPVVLG
jgi:aspartate dehydrogenase